MSMETLLTILVHSAAVALPVVVFLLRLRQIDGRTSPDCQYYLNMSIGKRVPRPYSARVLVPLATRLLGWLGVSPHLVMRGVVFCGVVAFLVASYVFVLVIGGSYWVASAAVTVLIMTEALVGTWIMFPWLADPWACAFGVMALCCGDPVVASCFLVLSAISKEGPFAVCAVFVALWIPEMWWAGIPGLLVWMFLFLAVPHAPPDTDWLKTPISYAHGKKRRLWFNYHKNIGHLKATPWIASWELAQSSAALPVLAACGVAWAQTLVAVDHARLIALAMIVVVPFAAVECDPRLLMAWVLLSLFWKDMTNMEYA